MTDYKSKLEKKDPCEHCGGPYGECLEIRGGFLPNVVCKNQLTYETLLKEYAKLQARYDALLDEVNENGGW